MIVHQCGLCQPAPTRANIDSFPMIYAPHRDSLLGQWPSVTSSKPSCFVRGRKSSGSESNSRVESCACASLERRVAL